MKKKSTILMLATCVLTLSACSDATANISKSSDALFTINGDKVTRGQIYTSLKEQGGPTTTVNLVKEKLFKLEKITLTDELIANGQSQLAKIKEQFGEQFESQIKSFGYTDEADFMKKYIEPNLFSSSLIRKYCNDDTKTLFKKMIPVKAQIFEFTDQAKADAAIQRLTGDIAFSDIGEEADKTTYDGSEKIYTTASTLPQSVLEFIKAAQNNGPSTTIADLTSGKFYLINITNVKGNTFTDEAIDEISNSASSTIQNDALGFYLKKHKFVIYDIDLIKGIEEVSDALVVQKNYKKTVVTPAS